MICQPIEISPTLLLNFHFGEYSSVMGAIRGVDRSIHFNILTPMYVKFQNGIFPIEGE